MLVAVVIVFILCWAPVLVDNVLTSYDILPHIREGTLKQLATYFQLLAYFNRFADFVFMLEENIQCKTSHIQQHVYCERYDDVRFSQASKTNDAVHILSLHYTQVIAFVYRQVLYTGTISMRHQFSCQLARQFLSINYLLFYCTSNERSIIFSFFH